MLSHIPKRNVHRLITRQKLPEAATRLRILLVEGNIVNQTVAKRGLEKTGHHVTVANNAVQALSMLDLVPFDLILMDVQMPEMDGITATKRIRQKETISGGHTPIIAITAHAMQGTREACLAAGMDGYVSKPINGKELEKCVMAAASSREAAGVAETGATKLNCHGSLAASHPARWEMRKVIERLGGDEALFREIANVFLQEAPKHLADLRQASQSGDAAKIARIGHTFKGELGYLGATAASQARVVEELGNKRDLTGLAEAVTSLEREILSLLEDVRKVVCGEASGC